MSDRTVSITLTAKDNVSKTFTAIGRSGEDMARALGRAATDAERDLDDLGDSAQKSGRSMDALRANARDLGLGLGVIAGAAALSGKAFRDQEVALNTLQRTYGDAAADLREFSNAIQDNTNFSNDAAIQAANIAGTLARNYGFTADEIQRVLQISVDLAATSGLGLADTTQRVTAALRGEAEGAEVLGLTLNQAAIDSQNLTLTMSNQEAGHFRLNALIEQSTFAQGAAAEQAEGTYGAMTNLRDSVQDAAQSFGEFLGPLGEVGAFAADHAVSVAALGLSIGQLGRTAVAAKNLIGAAGLAGSLGPAGLVGAAGLAVAGLVIFSGVLSDDIPDASTAAVESVETLQEAIIRLGESGQLSGSQSLLATRLANLPQEVETANTFLESANDGFEAFLESAIQAYSTFGESILPITDEMFAGLSEAEIALIDINSDHQVSVQELQAAYGSYGETLSTADNFTDGITAATQDLNTILQASGAGAVQAQTNTVALIDALARGDLTTQEFAAAVHQTVVDMQAMQTQAALNASATDGLTESNERYVSSLEKRQAAAARVAEAMAEDATHMGDAVEGDTEATRQYVTALDFMLDRQAEAAELIGGKNSLAALFDQQTASLDANADAWDRAADAIGSAIDDNLQDGIRGVRELGEAVSGLGEAGLPKFDALGAAQEQFAATFEAIRSEVTQTGEALDTVFGAIVGNTNKLAQSAQGVQDWADELIGAAGTVAEIDTLLANGAITQQEYNDAQSAYNTIAEANLSIQEDVLSIQAQLAPVIATSTDALADQLDAIAGGSTDAQLFALGMMDAATSSQALALAQGYLADQDTFGPMLVQAAELNPMLAQILEEMGLISYNPATGEVSLIGGDEVISDLDRVTEALDRLVQAEWVVMFNGDVTAAEQAYEDATGLAVDWDNNESTGHFLGDASGALNASNEAQNALGEWGRSSGTASIDANDNATGTINAAINALNAFDGRSAYASIFVDAVGPGLAYAHQLAHGGVIGGYADGGVIPQAAMGRALTGASIVGESGWELLLGGQGGMVVPHTGSVESVKGMGAGLPPINLNIYGNVYGMDDLTDKVVAELVPALQRAVRINNAGYGGRV